MKKILFLLLISAASYGQADFPEGVKLGGNTATAETSKIVSQQPGTGELNYINATALPVSTAVQGSLDTKENVANKQNSLTPDGTGAKYPTVDAVNAALPRNYTKVVYVNSTTPSTANIFDDENPPVVNDDLLKSDVANLYIGTDASPWVWNGSTYETKVVPASSNFYLSGTTIDAGNSKIEPIERSGIIKSGGVVTDGVYANAINVAFETPNTIASFDAGKQLKSLSTDTYPSLTELSYAKGVTSGIQSQLNGKADLDGSGKVLLSQINDALLGSVNYKGTYNATTNVPAIPTATSSNKGWYYIISTAGTQQGLNFVNGDWIISNGTSWGKVDNNNTVTSVNGQVGAVSVTTSSIGAQTTLTNPTTGVGSQNDPNTYALQDGTILYHSVKWFVPTGTVSTSGTTVTSVGTQFTSGMVGAKLTINGEWRIITAFTSSTVVTVASAYSQNYSGVVAGSWGVYSKSITFAPADNPTREGGFYVYNNKKELHLAATFARIEVGIKLSTSSNDSAFNPLANDVFQLGGEKSVVWFSGTGINSLNTTKDLGLRRNVAGVLEIYDGVTADGAIGNRRDLLARNISSEIVSSGSTTLGTSQPTANNQLTRKDYVDTALATKANDSDVVHKTGNETITGVKTFTESGFSDNAVVIAPGEIRISNNAIEYPAIIRADNVTGIRDIQMPNASGTIALTNSPAFTGTPIAPTAPVGTNTTQVATMAAVQAAIPYKSYVAQLSQVGTSNPSATILYNDTNETFTWTRNSSGYYVVTCSSGILLWNKSRIVVTPGVGDINQKTPAFRLNDTTMATYSVSGSNIPEDNILIYANVEIRIYK